MFDKLEPRERLLLFGGGALLLVVFLIFGTRFIYAMRARVSDEVATSRAAVQQMQRLRMSILSMKPAEAPPNKSQFAANVTNLLSSFNLSASTFNESEENTPQRTRYKISMQFRAVRLEDFLKCLHAIEYSRRVPANVDNVLINRVLSKELYDVNLDLSMSVPRTP